MKDSEVERVSRGGKDTLILRAITPRWCSRMPDGMPLAYRTSKQASTSTATS